MPTDIQTTLLQIIKERIVGSDTIGNVLADVLHISSDAAYRRNRNETPFTIHEVQKLCKHFNISFDALTDVRGESSFFRI